MKLAFVSLACPQWSLQRIATQAAALGYDGVDLRGVSGEHIGWDETPQTLAQVRHIFAGAGVAISGIMGYSDFAGDDPAQRQRSVRDITGMLRVAAELGCPLLRVFGGFWGRGGKEEAIARAAAALNPLAEQARRQGVGLALETHDGWRQGQDAMDLVHAVDSPALGICWDLVNGLDVEPMEQTFAAVAPRIVAVHIKDARRDEGGRFHAVLPGLGVVDIPKALGLLQGIGYQGYHSFEWEKKWEPDIAEPEQSLPWYVQAMKKWRATLPHEPQ